MHVEISIGWSGNVQRVCVKPRTFQLKKNESNFEIFLVKRAIQTFWIGSNYRRTSLTWTRFTRVISYGAVIEKLGINYFGFINQRLTLVHK